MKRGIAFVVILMSFFAVFAAKSKVAVMDIHDRSGKISNKIIENATEMIRGKLSSTGKFMVIDRSSQQKKMKGLIGKEKKESYKKNYDKESQIPLGRALAADSILRSTISCLGNDCMLSAELVDIAKEVSTSGGTSKFTYDKTDLSSLISAIEDVVEQVSEMNTGALAQMQTEPNDQFNNSYADPNASYRIIFDASEKSKVYVDGSRVCKVTPCQTMVQGGMHSVKMVGRKMAPMTEDIKFFRDERIVFQMTEKGAMAIINPVTEDGKPITNVNVLSKGQLLGTAPGSFFVTPENNRLLLQRDGFEDEKIKIRIKDGTEINLSPVLEFDTYRPFKGGAVAGFVVGGIVLAGGLVSMVVAEAMDAWGSNSNDAWLAGYAMAGIGAGGIVLGIVLVSIKKPVPAAENFTINVSGNGAKVSFKYDF